MTGGAPLLPPAVDTGGTGGCCGSLWLNIGGILVCTLFIMEALVGKASINRRSGGAGPPLPANIAGLLRGDTPRELNVDDVVDEVGDGLKQESKSRTV